MSVVVGYVPTRTGYLAVTEAVREAQWRGTELVIVNVVGPLGFTRPTAADEQDLDAVAARLTADGVKYQIRHVNQEVDHPSEEVLRAAEDSDAELIVVGLQRRSPMAKALLGSNAQRILLGASCPVLAVREVEEA